MQNYLSFLLMYILSILLKNCRRSNFSPWFFRGLTRWLRRALTSKVCNIGQFSKCPQVDKDPNFHLRPCLVGLDVKWGHQKPRKPEWVESTPPRCWRYLSKPGVDRVKSNFFCPYTFWYFWATSALSLMASKEVAIRNLLGMYPKSKHNFLW